MIWGGGGAFLMSGKWGVKGLEIQVIIASHLDEALNFSELGASQRELATRKTGQIVSAMRLMRN